MPEKKNEELNEEEMNAASGGAGYSISGSKTSNRSSFEESAEGVIPDPLGPPTSTGGSNAGGKEPIEPTVKP